MTPQCQGWLKAPFKGFMLKRGEITAAWGAAPFCVTHHSGDSAGLQRLFLQLL